MNVPKAIELAMRKVIRDNAEVGAGVTIRAWQTLKADSTWDESIGRVFPMIALICSPPRMGEKESSLVTECIVLMGTNADDDRDHAFISNMYDEIDNVCSNMIAKYHALTYDAEPLKTFIETVQDKAGETKFRFGGITFIDGMSPYDDGGINITGFSMEISYSRDDF